MRRPGSSHAALHSAYPERRAPRLGSLDRLAARVVGPFVRQCKTWECRRSGILERIARESAGFIGLSDRQIPAVVEELRIRLSREGFHPDLAVRSFAFVREVAERTLGKRHFDSQMLGGWALLRGMIAEMDTGEGKTLTATLPVCTAALAGVPVHVITVNDYLTGRDADMMAPLYQALGLSVGRIVHGMDPPARQAAYACSITYCTNKELAFDYLRDRLVLGRHPSRIQLQLERLYGEQSRARQLVLRGLHYAIVDEADSVLVDEARTPLIISGAGGRGSEQALYAQALALAKRLQSERDFTVDARGRKIHLTPSGEMKLEEWSQALGGMWKGPRRRESLARQALYALHLLQRDTHYLVRDDTVQIIDEYTGRILDGRKWEDGLHQMVETKEGCPLGTLQSPLARITYQRFFRRYLRLAGMTGTAQEVAGELWSVYRLPVVRIMPHRPSKRRALPDQVYVTAEEKWRAVVARIEALHHAGQPVLIGTRSVDTSEHVSRLLAAAELPHQVLNARQDQAEAAVVAQAGTYGRITVATNMAGRGTDIRLADDVVPLGGLHVIAVERNEARRIDRQLFGRCARQGDPGSYEMIVSLEDELVATYGWSVWAWVAVLGLRAAGSPWAWLYRMVMRQAQRGAERLHARVRRDVLRSDEEQMSIMAFSGQAE